MHKSDTSAKIARDYFLLHVTTCDSSKYVSNTFLVDFNHFHILRAIGKGAFGKVSSLNLYSDYHGIIVGLSGMHSKEEGYQADVCYEIYEQDSNYSKACSGKCFSRDKNPVLSRAPLLGELVVHISR